MWRAAAVVVTGCGRIGFGQLAGDAAPDVAIDASADVAAVTAYDLAGQRVLMPCGMYINAFGCLCAASPVVQTVTLDDTSAEHFSVTIRVRGALGVETYTGGTPDGSTAFYIGGSPADALYDTYQIAVTSPPGTFWLNHDVTVPTMNAVAFDYIATFPVDGGATVTFTGDCRDGMEFQNFDGAMQPITFPGVTTVPDPYDGQFAQIDVLSVVTM